jgi:hypothetical protein
VSHWWKDEEKIEDKMALGARKRIERKDKNIKTDK